MTNLSSCCGAPVKLKWVDCGITGSRVTPKIVCSACDKNYNQPAPIPKLTPEQVKAVRWPDRDVCMQRGMDLHGFAEWAIRYALQDLMEGEK